MPPPMKLTAEQMWEISFSIRNGLQNAAWEGLEIPWTDLSREQQAAVMAELRAEREAFMGSDPRLRALNEASLAHFHLDWIAQRTTQEATEREFWKSVKRTVANSRESMNEMLSQAVHFSLDQIRAVDRRLAAKNLPSLRELSGKLNRVRAGILKRGKIRSDAEFYVVKEIVCDTGSDVTDAERAKYELL